MDKVEGGTAPIIQKGMEDWLRETARRWMEDRPHWFM
jgi:hypothetical protein